MLTKMVDGQEVILTVAEETAARAEWALNTSRKIKRKEFQAEALRRVKLQVPEWDNEKNLQLAMKQWFAVLPLATPAMKTAHTIWVTNLEDSLKELKTMKNPTAIDAIDTTKAEPFGAGKSKWSA